MNTYKKEIKLFDSKIFKKAVQDSFKKLNPKIQFKNPVMFVVEIGAVITSYIFFKDWFSGFYSAFVLQITIWLWFTVLFANFAEAISEGRGKARADSLKKMKTETVARLLKEGKEKSVSASSLTKGDLVICEAGDIIPSDGDVIEGAASVNESAITGESAPVIRESGGDRSAVTGGTKVISDRIIIRITSEKGDNFIDKMIKLVEGARRQKTPNEIALTILLSSLTFIFLFATVTLYPFSGFIARESSQNTGQIISVTALIALLVCLIPTTIGSLLSAIGISGMDRLIRHNVIALSGKAVETAGDVDVLLLDKTGTITFGNRMCSDIIPSPGISNEKLAYSSLLASVPDETPEGRSIVSYIKDRFGIEPKIDHLQINFIPFSAKTRMSGIDIMERDTGNIREVRKGSIDAVKALLDKENKQLGKEVEQTAESISRMGGTPLIVTENREVLGVIHLKDIVKSGIKQRFESLRKMGIKTIMITGDNPLTAAAIAAEAGVDDFIAEATPEHKLERIRKEQEEGKLIAMIGDGTNDAPALAQADVGVTMNTGTQTAREAGNMIDLDSNPTKVMEVVEVGKQLLMTRGALTTFSIANDIAKYFAILPALFSVFYAASSQPGPLSALNIMRLQSPNSAILSAIIFNALIIICLIPLAIKGIKYRPLGSGQILLRNLIVYGLGGIIIPFIGIKLIDMLVNFLGLI